MNLMDGLGGRDKETLRQIYGGLEGVLLSTGLVSVDWLR